MTPWDAYDAYLFDIDGTLLNATDAVHYFAFCEALTMLAGRPLNLDGVTTHGNVDNGILRDALTLANVPEAEWRPRLPQMQQRMCAFVTRDQADLRLTVLPQVPEVLNHLRAKGAILGVATGNLEGIGRVKLAHAGLLDRFHFGGYSDVYETRHDVFKAAVEMARGLTSAGATICVVGDTPADVRAAHSNGLDVIAVATGIFSMEILQAEAPTRAIATLADLLTPLVM
ncbi:HAD family hydrolase [Granulicella arctica]|uniref:HAD family hydrolase n=1 Tax=Granulicella arctica TaxID=940613 RepID=UPI0021E0A75A|nr:HAD family hydrolase [Granulicella arctica]